jgi:hypothetical protein
MIAAVSWRLLYLIFQQLLRLVVLMGRTASTTDTELFNCLAPISMQLLRPWVS